MTAPLPRGVVRLTLANRKSMLLPAALIAVFPGDDDGESRIRLSGEAVADDCEPDFFCCETVDQIQAALVAALGAQGADGPTVVMGSGAAFAALQEVRVALGASAHENLVAFAINLGIELRTAKEALRVSEAARDNTNARRDELAARCKAAEDQLAALQAAKVGGA